MMPKEDSSYHNFVYYNYYQYHDNNLTMPKWFSPQLLTKLESIDDSLLRLMFSTKRKRKLTGG